MSSIASEQRILERFMQLSIAAALATIVLKAVSYTHLTLPTILRV